VFIHPQGYALSLTEHLAGQIFIGNCQLASVPQIAQNHNYKITGTK
jgi:hypothetical protein